jgi:hypothetical protein
MIDKIVDEEDTKEMVELSYMLEDTICELKKYDKECYNKYKMKLYGMANDYKFDKDYAMEIVSKMKPLAEVWDMETTTDVKNQYEINADDCDFYIVLNSLANDYGKIISVEEVETYAKMADAFINDADAKDNKVWIYYTKIPKGD